MFRTVALGILAFASVGGAHASTFYQSGTAYTISFSSSLPKSSFAPTDVIDSSGPVLTTPPSTTYVPGATYIGLTKSYLPEARSPFEGTSASSRPYDAVTYGGTGVSYATFGATPPSTSPAFGTGVDTFSFVYGSPDSYNTLQFLNASGGVIASFTGDQLTDPDKPTQNGFQVTTISAMNFNYSAVRFETTQNSFEFAGISSVPLPASAPLFGGALLVLGLAGFGLKRKAKPSTV